jgi:putative peptidoglycan lipid II flippase
MSKVKLLKNMGSMSFGVFISRIFGLIRDIVMMNFFGTSYVADAFQAGFRIPNLLRLLFGEGALSAAFVPIYNDIGVKQDKAAQIRFAMNMLNILCAILLLLSLLGMAFAPLIVRFIAPGFSGKTYELTVFLTRILFPYLFLIGFSSTLIAILNSHDYFFIPGLSSAFLNIGMLSVFYVFLLLYPQASMEIKIIVFSYGTLFGGILQTIINFPQLKKVGYHFRFFLNLKSDALKIVWQKYIPGIFGLAIREINLVVDTILASLLVTGSITALAMGNRLMQLPLGIIGVSAGVAVLPYFSTCIAQNDWNRLNESLRFSVLSVSYLMLPITAIIIGLGEEFIRILFMRGQFDEISLTMTYQALVFYSLGILFYGINRLLIPVFYADKDTKTPVKISAFIMMLNILLNLILMQIMQHAGLALATSLSAIAQCIILVTVLKKRYVTIQFDFFTDMIKIFLLSIFTLIIIIILKPILFSDSIYLKTILLLFFSLLINFFGSRWLHISYSEQIWRNLWKKIKRR